MNCSSSIFQIKLPLWMTDFYLKLVLTRNHHLKRISHFELKCLKLLLMSRISRNTSGLRSVRRSLNKNLSREKSLSTLTCVPGTPESSCIKWSYFSFLMVLGAVYIFSGVGKPLCTFSRWGSSVCKNRINQTDKTDWFWNLTMLSLLSCWCLFSYSVLLYSIFYLSYLLWNL